MLNALKLNKKMQQENKIRKIFIVTTFLLLIILSFLLLNIYQNNKKIDINGVPIKISDYKKAQELFKDDKGFIVCNFESGRCNLFRNLGRLPS